MDAVKLKMNPDKTEYIMFGSRIQLSKCVTNSINVVEDLIESSECIRYLGGFLDSDMSLIGNMLNVNLGVQWLTLTKLGKLDHS